MPDYMFIGETYGHKRLQCLQVMFLFTDAHVANESFLELINNMLTSGMIPALYDDGEKEGLISGIREEVIKCQAGCVLPMVTMLQLSPTPSGMHALHLA